MKHKFAFLALFAVASVVCPRLSQAQQQYAWVPVVSNEPIGTATQSPQITGTQTAAGFATSEGSFATYIGELAPDGGKGANCSQKGDCNCLACRNSDGITRLFGGAEYLHWWNKGRTLPPLASTGLVPPATVLFGGDVGDDLKSGFRFTAGMWIDDCETHAVVVRGFGSGGDRTQFNGIGDAGGSTLAVPFFDLFSNSNGALSVNVGGDAGTITAEASNDVLGGDAYFRTLVGEGNGYRLDLLGGYQMTRINDDLVFNTTSTNPFTTSDLFDVSNEYHAAEFGLMAEVYEGCTTLQFMGKCGVGNMRQTVGIAGNSSLAGIPQTGGLFARPSNIGFYRRDRVAWSPEASVKLIAAIRENISVTVGYTFMYWTNVALAGDQVNTQVNSTALFNGGGTDGTTFAFRDTDFWAQTIDIGLMVGY